MGGDSTSYRLPADLRYSPSSMRLFVPTMDAFLVEFDSGGRIRLDKDEWSTPSVQEQRAIIHAAQDELENLKELLAVLENYP